MALSFIPQLVLSICSASVAAEWGCAALCWPHGGSDSPDLAVPALQWAEGKGMCFGTLLPSPWQSKRGGVGQCEELCPSALISLSFPACPSIPYKCLDLKSES